MFGVTGLAVFAAATLTLAANAPSKKKPGFSVIHTPTDHPAATQPAHSASSGDVGVDDAAQSHESYKKAFEQLNSLNPMSAEYGKAGPSGAQQQQLTGPAAQLQSLLSNPAVQGYLKLFSRPSFAQGAEKLVQHHNRTLLIRVELVWFLLMFFSRSWRLSKLSTSNWGQVVWVNFSHMIFMWAGAVIALPWILLGDPYRQVLAGFLQVLTGG